MDSCITCGYSPLEPSGCPVCGTDPVQTAPLTAGTATIAMNGTYTGSEEPLPHSGANSQALASGTRLAGKYRIEEVLGQGAFGITYRAQQETLGLQVAIKELFPTGSLRQGTTLQPPGSLGTRGYSELKASFLTEGSTIARFNHPGIVRVYDVFEENSTAYLVMEFLEGRTLREFIAKQGTLKVDTVTQLATGLSEALEELHTAGLLHRDLKPDNIVLAKGRRAVLIDFGSARNYGEMTVRHTQLVTPGYAPLEQYASQARVGPSTDLYALGATLYHALTGIAPPSAPDRVNGTMLPGLPPETPTGLREAILASLNLKAQDRPANAHAFRALLQAGSEPSPPVGRSVPRPALPEITRRVTQKVTKTEVPSPAPKVRAVPSGRASRQMPFSARRIPLRAVLMLVGLLLGALYGYGRGELWHAALGGLVGLAVGGFLPLFLPLPLSLLSAALGYGLGVGIIRLLGQAEVLLWDGAVATVAGAGGMTLGALLGYAGGKSLQQRQPGLRLPYALGLLVLTLLLVGGTVAGLERTVLPGHNAGVTVLRFSRDGATLASGSHDSQVRLYTHGRYRNSLRGHDGSISALAFSFDGTLFASGDTHGRIILWEVSSGRQSALPSGHNDTVYSLAFSPNGRTLTSESANERRTWDVTQGAAAGLEDIVSLRLPLAVRGARAWNLGGQVAVPGFYHDVRLWQVRALQR